MTLPTAEKVTSVFLFGTETPPSNFSSEVIIASRPSGVIEVSMSEFMDSQTGPGRFALASEFELVELFFSSSLQHAEAGSFNQYLNAAGTAYELTKLELATFFGIQDFFGLNITQKDVADSFDDLAARTYIWNNTRFKLDDDVKFVITVNGDLYIEDLKVVPRDVSDDFDFESEGIVTNIANTFLEHGVDPSGIGEIVKLEFFEDPSDPLVAQTYTLQDYENDVGIASTWTSPTFSELFNEMDVLLSELFNNGITATLDGLKPVIYGTNGDDVFVGTETPYGYDISDESSGVIGIGSVDHQLHEFVPNGITYVAGDGHDNISGTVYDDVLIGGGGADTIDGGAGVDVVRFSDGGSGVTIFADGFEDAYGSGGEAEGDEYLDVEAFIGTNDSDTFTGYAFSEENDPLLLSGGGGNDRFDVISDGVPVVIWGGAGADEIVLAQSGVMVVNVTNLTEDNFHLFSLDMLELGPNFNWGAIDVVLLNPDASDTLFRSEADGGAEYAVGTQTFEFETYTFLAINPDGSTTQESTVNSFQFFGFESADSIAELNPQFQQPGEVVGSFNVDFGSGVYEVFGHAANVKLNSISVSDSEPDPIEPIPGSADFTVTTTSILGNNGGGADPDTGETDNYFWIDYASSFSGHGSPVLRTRGEENSPNYQENFGFDNLSDIPVHDSEDSTAFFILGGSLSGSQIVSNHQFQVTLPNADGSFNPGGDSNNTNFGATPGGSGTTNTYSGFSTTSSVLVLGGAPIDPNAPPADTTVEQSGSDVVISTSSGNIVLQDVSLSEWQAAAQAFEFGSSGDDQLALSSADEIISTGSGNDTVDAKLGDDTISYHSGDDLIIGGAGSDTLDLSRYRSDEVTFRNVVGHDVIIETPDGAIELHYQGRYAVGHGSTNIETLTFSDITLDDAGIRQRALDDQNTDGNDAIRGTLNADIVTTSAGNDTVDALGGNDTISYGSGDDYIVGGTGSDVLDLSQYSADEVTFRNVVGHDVTIETPDGTIELHYQARFAIGHGSTNIETLTFSDITLDDAGIRQRALDDQNTDGNDVIRGTLNDDTVTTSAGNDTVDAMHGDDTIFYGSGNDKIIGGAGNDTLDLSQYASDEVVFRNVGRDVMIETADGTIELHDQTRNALGHSQSNIETLVFSDITLDDAGLRQRALDDQNASGNDIVEGTQHTDLISGGIGQDTLKGFGGTDVFAFSSGDGADQIDDFEDGLDMIRFTGGPSSFADLTITDAGNDVVVAYGGSDTVQLSGISSLQLSEDDFEFV